MTPADTLLALAGRVARGKGCDNALDVEVEIALFRPDHRHVAVRANAAGTKVIFTTATGEDYTAWACDWTFGREETAAALRARAALASGVAK